MVEPTWDQYMAPALRILADGSIRRARDICESAADILGVTHEERLRAIPSGQPRYLNRTLWALSYLFRAGAVDRPARGNYVITETGRGLLASHPTGITEKDLRTIDGYVSPHERGRSVVATTSAAAQLAEEPESALSPLEQVEEGIERIHSAVASELLTRLHANDPAFFEQAVLELLMGMGYGGAEGTSDPNTALERRRNRWRNRPGRPWFEPCLRAGQAVRTRVRGGTA